MKNFLGNTANDVWKEAATYLNLSNETSEHSSRIGDTLEILGASFSIVDPRQRWVASRLPAINPSFALAEVIWILNGSQEAKILNHWNPALPKFAGSRKYYHGAYGYRLKEQFGINQIERAYHALKNNQESRQVVLQLWDAQKDMPDTAGSPVAEDIPCNIVSMLNIRNGKLEWMQILRSNDLFLGTPYNFVQFTSVQEIIAGWLELEPGKYCHVANSLHCYKKDIKNLLSFDEIACEQNNDNLAIPKEESEKLTREIFNKMKLMADESISKKYFENLINLEAEHSAFNNILFLLGADSARRRGWNSITKLVMKKNTNPVYNQLWERWEKRISVR